MNIRKRIFLAVIIITLTVLLAAPVYAGSFKTVRSTKVKYGSYYVWRPYNTEFYVQNTKTGAIKVIGKQVYTVVGVTNGIDLYYTSLRAKWDGKVTLYKYNLKTGKEKKITTIKNALHIEGYYNGNVYGNGADSKYGRANNVVYKMNIKTRKKSIILKGYWLERTDGKYMYLTKGGIAGSEKFRYDLKRKKLMKYEWEYLY